MAEQINNSQDIIDSRDVIERIEELSAEIECANDVIEDENIDGGTRRNAYAEREEAQEELTVLKALADEAEGYAPDWQYGEALIRDSYFDEYARELANDIGEVNADAGWPNDCIDWQAAAVKLQIDYTAVEFDGITYWIR